MRLLLINFETALGSAVHATPVFAAIKQAQPEWELHLLSAGITSDVLGANPHIDRHWIAPHLLKEPLAAAKWLLKNRWRMGHYDHILFNSGNSRTKVLLLSRLIKGKRRGGFAVRNTFIDDALINDPGVSLIANNLKLLDLLQIPQPVHAEPEVWYGAKDAQSAAEWREKTAGPSAPVIGFFAGTSGGQPNQWFEDRFAVVANDLHRELGSTAVFFGGSKDYEDMKRLAALCAGPSITMAGRTTIQQLAATIATCDLIVTVDTGGLHVARAIGTPTVVIGNAANPAHIWLPDRNPAVDIIRKDEKVPCALCMKLFCATRECMQEITQDEVSIAALKMIRSYPLSESSRVKRLQKWINPALDH